MTGSCPSDKASWRGVRLETSGTAEFTWVWAFKVLILIFAALLFIQAVAFLLRNLWALLERDEEVESHPVDPHDRNTTAPDSVPEHRLSVPPQDTVSPATEPPFRSARAQLASVRSTDDPRRLRPVPQVKDKRSADPGRVLSPPSLAPAGVRPIRPAGGN
jgi:hypothetical protein